MTQAKVVVGLGSCGIAAGAGETYEAFRKQIAGSGLDVELQFTGCSGLCNWEPIVQVNGPAGDWTYGEMCPERVSEMVRRHLVAGEPIEEWTLEQGEHRTEVAGFLSKQVFIELHNCGKINPERIEDYEARAGYKALEKCLNSMAPEDVIDQIRWSGLRGRGGIGAPTALKWETARRAAGPVKYVICNADEGDPGAFMNRGVLEGDPHSVLEGMAIVGYALGSHQGFVYCRAEYSLANRRLEIALRQAREHGYLGDRILGSGFSFDIELRKGAGAFVCGEETALIASLEGQRAMPRQRPPYPTVSGLFGRPTVINNVGTLVNVPWIVQHGARAYAKYGLPRSRGTKVFSLAGRVARCGLVEVPFGTTVGEIIYGVGGGSPSGKPMKAAHFGGPIGGCIPYDLFDTPIGYEELASAGAGLGSGGIIALDQDCCMVDTARYFLEFLQGESCGKCTFCRIGTRRMYEILTRITRGEATLDDLDLLEHLAYQTKNGSLCGLGIESPNPVLTTLRYFRDEYLAHIQNRECPAHVCQLGA